MCSRQFEYILTDNIKKLSVRCNSGRMLQFSDYQNLYFNLKKFSKYLLFYQNNRLKIHFTECSENIYCRVKMARLLEKYEAISLLKQSVDLKSLVFSRMSLKLFF